METPIIESDTPVPYATVNDDTTPSSRNNTESDTESAAKSVDKFVCACCDKCGRVYESPLDLPPVIITTVAKLAPPVKIAHTHAACFPPNSKPHFEQFLCNMSTDDQTKLRAINDASPTENQDIAVTMASGEPATCVIGVWSKTLWHFNLIANFLPHIAHVIPTAASINPFVVCDTSVSVRAIWDAIPLKRGYFGTKYPWIRKLSGDAKGYFLGIDSLRFITPESGYFTLELIRDNPDIYTIRKEMFDSLMPTYRIEFTLAPTNSDKS